MTKLIIIAAVAKNGVISNKGKIPWRIKEDFQHFRKLTTGYPIIMGRKTFESLPIRPLPGRENIVITRQNDFSYPGIIVKSSMEEAINHCKNKGKAFIIGGREIYSMGLEIADTLELTRIDRSYDGDTYFPEINFDDWQLVKKRNTRGSLLTHMSIKKNHPM